MRLACACNSRTLRATPVGASRRRTECSANPSTPAPAGTPRPLPRAGPRRTHGGAWQRGGRCPQPPASVAAPAEEGARTLTLSSGRPGRLTFTIKPRAPPLPYSEALHASIRRDTITAAKLLEVAVPRAADDAAPRLQQQLEGLGALEPYEDTLQSGHSTAVEALLRQWRLDAPSQPPGFDRQCQLTVPDVADAAVATCGGRSRGQWKSSNQDAFLACPVASPSGASPALLLGVFDGHGCGGDNASHTAAGGLAGAVPAIRNQLRADAGWSRDGASASAAPVPQQALVRAFQAVAASMRYDSDFQDCGAAAVACLVEEDSITAAWAGDCRAVVGLSVDTAAGPSVLVHALTQDHKPSSPLERSRIASSGKGRVVQLRRGQPHRLCGTLEDSTLSLSRAFGDAWAVPLGLTAEPDAVSLMLPPAVPTTTAASSASSPSCPLDSFVIGSFVSADVDDATPAAGPARHVLVLGSDGLWDMLSNDAAVAIAMSSSSAEAAASALLHAAQRKWAAAYSGAYADDITVAVAFLPA